MSFDISTWNITPFVPPLITAVIAFFLNKYFQHKPKLITYYGSISSHKIVSEIYPISVIEYTDLPKKSVLDSLPGKQVPIIIKCGDDVWIYGVNVDGGTQLTKSDNPEVYSLQFSKDLETLKETSDLIYQDIRDNSAHNHFYYVNTHEIVVKNTGRLPARNVRLGHKKLPNYTVNPSVQHEVHEIPGGGQEIIFPCLVPYEEITVSYLYWPPLVYTSTNTHVKSDEGFAQVINAIPTPSLPSWLRWIKWILLFVGGWTIINVIFHLVTCLSNSCFK